MHNHAALRHRQAARALAHRNPTNVQVLAERFSPTAVFPGMGGGSDPFFFPGGDDDSATPRRGHHTKTRDVVPTLPVPTMPFPIITPGIQPPPLPLPDTTTSIVVTPIISQPVLPPLSSSTVASTTPAARTTTPLAVSAHPTTASPGFPPAVAATSAASRPSQSSQPSSGISAGAVVGGIGAGLLALAAIGFAVAFFIRRTRKRDTDAGFDAADFRRSALVLHDPPTHQDTIARGYNPPPSGMEQRQQIPASAPAWGYDGSHYGDYNPYQSQPYPSFAAGQVVLDSPPPPPTAISAQSPSTPPVTFPRQIPISPISPLPSPYEQSNSEREAYPETSEATHQAPIAPYPTLTRQLTTRSTEVPADDYVDLNRSSVSPFQAAQYAEISRRLNAESLSDKSSPAQLYATQQKDLPPVPPSKSAIAVSGSPFADPEVPEPPAPVQLAPPSPRTASAPTPTPAPVPTPPTPSTLNVQTLHVPAFSTDSLAQEELQFPVPPSPALSSSSRYRVESLPPTLPEIKVEERSSFSSYITKSPVGSGFPSGVSGIGMQVRSDQRFVNTPSPLASSFGVATPAVEDSRFAAAQEQGLKERSAPQPTTSTVGPKDSKDSKRPDTVYDPEDVYGGI